MAATTRTERGSKNKLSRDSHSRGMKLRHAVLRTKLRRREDLEGNDMNLGDANFESIAWNANNEERVCEGHRHGLSYKYIEKVSGVVTTEKMTARSEVRR